MKNPFRQPPTSPWIWSVGGITVRGSPSMKSATEYPVMSPVKLKRPRASFAACRPVSSRRRSKPARMLWFPRTYERTSDTWNVLSNWYQFVPPAPIPLKLPMLTLGMPGLLYFTSPSNPGIPSDEPASVSPLTAKGFRVSKLIWW